MTVCAAVQAFHIGRIEYDAIERSLCIRQLAAINARFEVAWQQLIILQLDVPPENSKPVSNVGNLGPLWNMEAQYLGKDFGIVANMGGNRYIRSANAALDTPTMFRYLRPE